MFHAVRILLTCVQNTDHVDFGKSNISYAKSTPDTPKPKNLPDPGKIFDCELILAPPRSL